MTGEGGGGTKPARAAAAGFSPRDLLAMAVVGSLVGTLGDRVQTFSGVLRYPASTWQWQDEAWWVPLLFASVGPLGLGGHRAMRRAFGEPPVPRSRGDLVLATVLIALAYVATGVLAAHPLTLLAVLAAAFVVRAALARSRALLAAAAIFAAGGALVEPALVATGAFEYSVPVSPLGIPWWLPGLYVHVTASGAVYDDACRRR